MSKLDIAIVDYGVGNIFSLESAFGKLDRTVVLTLDPKEISQARAIVLPGVGAFGSAIQNLEKNDLIDPLKQAAGDGRPILGICLGMQLLMTDSEEGGSFKGLGLIPGHVRKLTEPQSPADGFKIPQIGWNHIFPPNGHDMESAWKETFLAGLDENNHAYFLHSYVVEPESAIDVIAVTHYGMDTFCSVLGRGNLWGCQFHPERSNSVGKRMLENFVTHIPD
jgi:glutamine amidotransferase